MINQRKFDRIFTSSSPSPATSTSMTLSGSSLPILPKNKETEPLGQQDCCPKIDKIRQKQLRKYSAQLDDQLRLLQLIGLRQLNLLLDDHTLQEIKMCFIELVAQRTSISAAADDSADWWRKVVTQNDDNDADNFLPFTNDDEYQNLDGKNVDEDDAIIAKYGSAAIQKISQLCTLFANATVFDNIASENLCGNETKNRLCGDGVGGDEHHRVTLSPSIKSLTSTSSEEISSTANTVIITTTTGTNSEVSDINLKFSATVSIQPFWQFWFWRSDRRYSKWEYGLQKLAKPIYDHAQLHHVVERLIDVHEVAVPSDYSFFRVNIKPKWEDNANRDGGSWLIEFDRNTTDPKIMQKIWLKLLEFVIGNTGHQHQHQQQHEQPSAQQRQQCQTKLTPDSVLVTHICGLKISMRFKTYKISIWTTNFVDLQTIFELGIAIQHHIGPLLRQLPHCAEFFYRAHKVSQTKALIKERTKFGGEIDHHHRPGLFQ